jgi:hypothetical protein
MGRAFLWLLIAIKYIAPVVMRVFWFMFKLILTTVLAFWTGVPVAVTRIVHSWMEQAWNMGIPTEYDTILHWVFIIVAYVMIFAGWIGFSYLTVFLLRWLL